MVFVLYLVIALGLVAFVWGGVWVLKIAFGVSAGWGLVCLVFPPVFFARNWRECRLPLFINLSGILVFLIGMMGYAGFTENAKVKELARVEWEDLDVGPNAGLITRKPWWNENQRKADLGESQDFVDDVDNVNNVDNVDNVNDAGNESSDPAVENPAEVKQQPSPELMPTLAPVPMAEPADDATPTPLPPWLKRGGRVISRDEYESYIGSMVQIYTADGQTFRVFLVRSSDSSIRVRERVGSGSVEFSLDHNIVLEVRVKN